MIKEMVLQLAAATVFCVIAILLLNPMHFWMPTSAHMTILAIGAVAFGAFATLVVRERALDERDEVHRSRAGRAAFLIGSFLLVVGIAVESISHEVDPWLVIVLLGMVIAKVGARLWSAQYR
ncbi:MAG TPA: hypothetical protein VMU25_00355 [Candidatus Paceibacterota bacterium]|nr:hypothetical protein [Candidatus Paceibacterota bacterium]